MIPLAVVILGGSRNTWDTDRTLGTGELNVPLWSFWEEVETPGIQTVPWGQEN